MAVLARTNGTARKWLDPFSDMGDKELVETFQMISWIVAGVFGLLACVTSFRQIQMHLRHFSAPVVQRKVVGILWIVPIFAVDSWLSLRFIGASVYLDMFRDCYEAYVIHLFLSLMIAYLSKGEEHILLEIDPKRKAQDPENGTSEGGGVDDEIPVIKHLFPFRYCLSPWPLDRNFLKRCKRGTLQFCILKPTLTVVAAICELNGTYDQGTFDWGKGYIYVTMVENLSITYAAYVLMLFYMAFKEDLKPYNPVPKFLCIKAVLFLSFWQSVLFAIGARVNLIHEIGRFTTDNVQTGLNNLSLCIEMFLIALAHKWAFPYEEYQGAQQMRSGLLSDNFAFSDTLRDFNDSKLVPKIVLPTGFTPGEGTVNEKPILSSLNGGGSGGNLIVSNAPSQEDAEMDRGWRM